MEKAPLEVVPDALRLPKIPLAVLIMFMQIAWLLPAPLRTKNSDVHCFRHGSRIQECGWSGTKSLMPSGTDVAPDQERKSNA
jgi:hypothetical protein